MACYPEYRTINLPWLKKIPVNWRLVRNKQFLLEKKDLAGNLFSQYTLLSLTLNGIIKRDLSGKKGKLPSSFDTYKVIEPGDFICCLFDMDETPRTVGLSEYNGMITGAYTVFGIHDINPEFLYYYYLSLDNIKALRPLYTGLRKTIKTDTFLALKLPVPPRAEQDQIVRFLDWKVSEINKLIHIKKELIERISEKLLVKTNYLLTHGKKTHDAFIRTAMDWAPEIPNSWSVSRIRNHFEILKRIAGKEGYDVFSITQQGLKVRNVHLYEGQLAADYSGYQFVSPGEFAMNHMDLLTGGVGIAEHLGVTSPDYRVFKLFDDKRCYAPYYLYIFQLCYRRHAFYRFGRGAATVGRWRLPADAFKNFEIPVPPYDEQVEIVGMIDKEAESTKIAIEYIQRQIENLKELKSVIISDVVTGKIDVRNITIPAYEHVDDVADDDTDNDDEAAEAGEEEG